MIKIQATISGYSGKACTLFSAYDSDNRRLAIHSEANYRAERTDGCAVITNDSFIDRDTLFSSDNLGDSIEAFSVLKNGVAADGYSPRLAISPLASRANPGSAIETDGYTEQGPKYKIMDGITCAQVAALCTCWYACRLGVIEQTVGMADILKRLLRGEAVTF